MTIYTRTVETIVNNRISTTEICDVMNKTGVLLGIRSLNQSVFAAGKVRYVYAHSGTNYHLHEQLANIEQDVVIYVDAFGCEDRAVFGDLVSKYLLLYRRARAIVANGLLRDANDLIKERRLVWCQGVTPIGCHNVSVPVPTDIQTLAEERKQLFESSILVCDDSGVAMIQPQWITEEILRKLQFIEIQEDIWYFCIDTLKWTTYETVALKRYLETPEVLPPILRAKITEYDI